MIGEKNSNKINNNNDNSILSRYLCEFTEKSFLIYFIRWNLPNDAGKIRVNDESRVHRIFYYANNCDWKKMAKIFRSFWIFIIHVGVLSIKLMVVGPIEVVRVFIRHSKKIVLLRTFPNQIFRHLRPVGGYTFRMFHNRSKRPYISI